MLHLYASLIPHCNSGVSDGKESTCNVGDLGSIPGLGKSPGGGHGNPLQSCLESAHGQKCLACYSPWGHRESDTTEQQRTHLCDNSWNQVVQVIWFCCPWKSYYFFFLFWFLFMSIYIFESVCRRNIQNTTPNCIWLQSCWICRLIDRKLILRDIKFSNLWS